MTDREKLIELLRADPCPSPHLCDGDCKYAELPQCFEDRIADHLIANGVTVQQWISVEDRLPEPCVSVLTLRRRLEDGACSQRVDSTIPIYDGAFVWFSDAYSWKTKVTHWMPLPKAPKGE